MVVEVGIETGLASRRWDSSGWSWNGGKGRQDLVGGRHRLLCGWIRVDRDLGGHHRRRVWDMRD